MYYDIVIIGAGIAGLYYAYLIKKKNPNIKLIILEKTKYIGGRVLLKHFHGVDVLLGSGVGRVDKDKLLLKLLKDLGINNIKQVTANQIYLNDTKYNFKKVNKIFDKKNVATNLHETFSEFAKGILGSKDYEKFIIAAGYTDYENADYKDVIQFYGMDDNMVPMKIFYIPWKLVIQKLVDYIGINNIKLGNEVSEINNFTVKTTNGNEYIGHKVVCAGTIQTLHALFKSNPIYKEIKGQPFLRIYVKFSDSTKNNIKSVIKTTTIVGFPLQKIIPIDSEKGVYMIAYTDNKFAKFLYKIIKSKTKKEINTYLETTLSKILKIDNIEIEDNIYHYWINGTHYNKPLSNKYKDRYEFIEKAQRPFGMDKEIYIIGEVVALHQGWCEGALESVQNIL